MVFKGVGDLWQLGQFVPSATLFNVALCYRRTSKSKSLTDSDSSDDNKVNPRFKTSVEERQYNTISESATATHIALSYSRAQVNPTVE